MRREVLFNDGWTFYKPAEAPVTVRLPHTWNGFDGQDGGDDYWRGRCRYEKIFSWNKSANERVFLLFEGVNASAEVSLNGVPICSHDGGYSSFTAELTEALQAENLLQVTVDNGKNTHVYPQKADFTFYGGIYRDVHLVVTPENHFDLLVPMKITPIVDLEKHCASVTVETRPGASVEINGEIKQTDEKGKALFTIMDVHLWDGMGDPYLYAAYAKLPSGDEVSRRFGCRCFSVDADKGFFLNGRHYPLHGVTRHQDRPGKGNAVSSADHEEDIALILEMGANAIRLSHYQHAQAFYDLCDEKGFIVWAEIPYISEHLPDGDENAKNQMEELIAQCYNHPSVVCWGISNEITISTKDRAAMLKTHQALNELCHHLDPTRLTTLAVYAMGLIWDKTVHLTDLVGYNLYLGWYVPGKWLNEAFLWLFHKVYPKRMLCFSEYGAECLPHLHAAHPKRGDHTEEYQCLYHEHMLRCFEKFPNLWGTFIWTMFDFGSDFRDQGGMPGKNYKGLVTFDRKIKKDAFYLYKAWWSNEPFVHICSKRFTDRTGKKIAVKIYSNQPEIAISVNGKEYAGKIGDKVFTFTVPLSDGVTVVKASAGEVTDEAVFRLVKEENSSYHLKKKNSKNWM